MDRNMSMNKEDKDLLLKYLCLILPYRVKVLNMTFESPQIQTLFGRISEDEFIMEETYKQVSGEDYRIVKDDVHYSGNIEMIKPYLRPMSSMTTEEMEELENISRFKCHPYGYNGKYLDNDCTSFSTGDIEDYSYACITEVEIVNCMIFLLSHHLDFNGLIPKGLALEAEINMYK